MKYYYNDTGKNIHVFGTDQIVDGELITEKETTYKWRQPMAEAIKKLPLIEISSRSTYFSFGVRFPASHEQAKNYAKVVRNEAK